MTPQTILVATTNPGKVAEFKRMLATDQIHWIGLKDLPPMPEVEEDGETFAENARKKARVYAQMSGLWTLSDDSGLSVDALNGAPGVYSARYAGLHNANRQQIDQANMAKVLHELQEIPPHQRKARFVCYLCLASPEKVLLETEGTCEGMIADKLIGEQGFGYDPIFFVPSFKKTYAQLNPDEKNDISHRGRALKAIRPALQKLIDTTNINE